MKSYSELTIEEKKDLENNLPNPGEFMPNIVISVKGFKFKLVTKNLIKSKADNNVWLPLK